jgi:hypothetical protein
MQPSEPEVVFEEPRDAELADVHTYKISVEEGGVKVVAIGILPNTAWRLLVHQGGLRKHIEYAFYAKQTGGPGLDRIVGFSYAVSLSSMSIGATFKSRNGKVEIDTGQFAKGDPPFPGKQDSEGQ